MDRPEKNEAPRLPIDDQTFQTKVTAGQRPVSPLEHNIPVDIDRETEAQYAEIHASPSGIVQRTGVVRQSEKLSMDLGGFSPAVQEFQAWQRQITSLILRMSKQLLEIDDRIKLFPNDSKIENEDASRGVRYRVPLESSQKWRKAKVAELGRGKENQVVLRFSDFNKLKSFYDIAYNQLKIDEDATFPIDSLAVLVDRSLLDLLKREASSLQFEIEDGGSPDE